MKWNLLFSIFLIGNQPAMANNYRYRSFECYSEYVKTFSGDLGEIYETTNKTVSVIIVLDKPYSSVKICKLNTAICLLNKNIKIEEITQQKHISYNFISEFLDDSVRHIIVLNPDIEKDNEFMGWLEYTKLVYKKQNSELNLEKITILGARCIAKR